MQLQVKSVPKDIERKLQAVMRRIEESAAFDGVCGMDFNEATSVFVLASVAGMSERSLRDYFRAYTGMSMVDYVSFRRAEYAARIFRLFPRLSKAKVAYAIGFTAPNGIYGLMRKNGVDNIDSFKGAHSSAGVSYLHFRYEKMPEYTLFYRQIDTHYKDCATIGFEEDNWDVIERYVGQRYSDAVNIGYVGFAIDRYLKNDSESGLFISGIVYSNVRPAQKDVFGDIGWRMIPSKEYAVFAYRGSYDGLSSFYDDVVFTINSSAELNIDVSMPFMEKYLNSPTDTPTEELITEIWVALMD